MKYEADVVDWLAEGEERGIAKGRENERSAIRKIFELARDGRSAENIAADLNVSREYVEETLDMVAMK